MDDAFIRQALRAHVADRPALGLTSRGLIVAGRRSRRLRIVGFTVAGPLAFASMIAIGALVVPRVYPGFGGESPVAAAPDASTCASLRAAPPTTDVRTTQEAADRLTCYLLDSVPQLLPAGTMFDNNAARPGTAALVAVSEGKDEGDQVTATATVTDTAGEGVLVVSVSRSRNFSRAEAAEQCASPHAKASCQSGPHGEHIEVYDIGKDAGGIQDRMIRVYSGHTFISIGAHNAPESRSNTQRPTRSEPPFTIDQLITLATAPELRLYP
jgi:hypothetical protein